VRATRRSTWIVTSVVALLLVVSTAFAQRGWQDGEFGFSRRRPPRFRPPTHASPAFSFCRLMFTSVRREPAGSGWTTDYPYADINFMIRLSELTKTQVDRDAGGDPNHWVVRLTDEGLFDCPFVMASDVGTIGLTPEEAAGLRTYLMKGGFLWVDDFWGTAAWDQWTREIAKALPPADYPIIEASPDHPIFRTMFNVDKVPQITNIGFWRGVGGRTTSERGTETAQAHLRLINDANGRIMVVMTHNTDVADSWEREGEDPEFFRQFSPDGYAFGINVLMYAMTH
jgi:hypothetical protein